MVHRVFIVDDHEIMREMLVEFLALEPDLTVCGEAANAQEALDRFEATDPDIVLVDVALPKMNGVELVRRLRARQPGLRCLMLSAHAEHLYVQEAIDAGARGYVMKGSPEAILEAIRVVLDGSIYLSRQVRTIS